MNTHITNVAPYYGPILMALLCPLREGFSTLLLLTFGLGSFVAGDCPVDYRMLATCLSAIH